MARESGGMKTRLRIVPEVISLGRENIVLSMAYIPKVPIAEISKILSCVIS